MFIRLRYLISLSLCLPLLARAEPLEFTHTARVVMGSRETQEECREFAKVEARRAVLDQVGVYIEGRSDLMQHIRESDTGLTEETDMQKRVLAIAAGVTQLEVTNEEWKSEGGALVLYLTCRVTVDPDNVAQRLAELVKDRQKVEDYEQVQVEVERLRAELTQLRADLESAKDEVKNITTRKAVKNTVNELTSKEWFEKGLSCDDRDASIAAFSKAISLDPSWSKPYILRGMTFVGKDMFENGLSDINEGLALEPRNARNYFARAWAYDQWRPIELDFIDLAIADYTKAISIDSSFAACYHQRGRLYGVKAIFNKASKDSLNWDRYLNLAIQDLSISLQIDPDKIKSYSCRALIYEEKGEINNAIRDYQRAADLGDEKSKRKLEELK